MMVKERRNELGKKKKLSQEDYGKRIGVKQGTISRIEQCKEGELRESTLIPLYNDLGFQIFITNDETDGKLCDYLGKLHHEDKATLARFLMRLLNSPENASEAFKNTFLGTPKK